MSRNYRGHFGTQVVSLYKVLDKQVFISTFDFRSVLNSENVSNDFSNAF